jgi:diketogulonate reductase-like aldo/keto reductase
MEYIKLVNGVEVPMFAFGTDCIRDGVDEVVYNAIKIGYRHFDTAAIYQNEEGIGKAFKRAIDEGLVKRRDLFITTRAPWNGPGYEHTLESYEDSLRKLGLDYIDLYLIHHNYKRWDAPVEKIYHTWRAMVKLYKEGRVRAIGVSNFNQADITQVFINSEVSPMVNQIELHPEHQQRDLVKFCEDRDVKVMAWGSLNQGKVFSVESLKLIANKYNKKESQLVLRWGIQKGFVINAKSKNLKRLKENFAVWDFEILESDMKIIDKLDGGRFSGFAIDDRNQNMIGSLTVGELYSKIDPAYINIYKLFDVIPLFKTVKIKEGKVKYYILGIPIITVRTKIINKKAIPNKIRHGSSDKVETMVLEQSTKYKRK